MNLIKKSSFFITLIWMSLLGIRIFSQAPVPPPGKYNTTNYPDDRKAIAEMQARQGPDQYLNDDLIAVGPEGKISYGFEQWKKGFDDHQAAFKSVTPIPGAYVLRIYNGDAAVSNNVLDVVFDTPAGDLYITVVRTETYIKHNGKWYFVAGQGTRKISQQEEAELTSKMTKTKK